MQRLVWDPNPIAFTLPLIDHPIAWYGILIALGFLIGYMIVEKKLSSKEEADSLLTHLIVGTIVGARLGDVLFYDLPLYLQRPWEIFMIWKGGLSSHGGTIGVFVSVMLFAARWKRSWKRVLAFICFPTALVGAFIRIGNFINQEILGTPTDLPWAVLFVHPRGGETAVPRHPAQLYEALLYFATFIVLFFTPQRLQVGLFFTLVFGGRFCIEFVKQVDSMMLTDSVLSMGQWLSIPCIVFGLFFLWKGCYAAEYEKSQKRL